MNDLAERKKTYELLKKKYSDFYSQLTNPLEKFDSRDEQAKQEIELQATKTKGLHDFLELRNYWSPRIFRLVLGVIVYQCVVTLLVGFNVYGFKDNFLSSKEFFIAVFIQNLGQIIGLSVIVTTFLFSKKKKT